jgi:hypothetical protein
MRTRRRLVLACAIGALAACATTKDRRYPPRRPGCHLNVSYAASPLASWDDIGVAQIGCYLDEGEGACLHRLKAEACRMGGDVLYAVPRVAARPGEREMTMRGRVAHTRADAPKPDDAAPPATNEPVVPIGQPAPGRDQPPPAAASARGTDAGAPTRDAASAPGTDAGRRD